MALEEANELEGITTRLRDTGETSSSARNRIVVPNFGSAIERLGQTRHNFSRFEEYLTIERKEDSKIKSRLFQDDLDRMLVPIVGCGGWGKTTLAKTIFHSNNVTDHFDCRVWITVSQAYSAKGLLEDIWKMVINTSTDNLTIQQMAKELCMSLKEKKYLVVMDDVCDVQAWKNVKAALPDSKNGSRVLLTTRSRDVALEVGKKIRPHNSLDRIVVPVVGMGGLDETTLANTSFRIAFYRN